MYCVSLMDRTNLGIAVVVWLPRMWIAVVCVTRSLTLNPSAKRLEWVSTLDLSEIATQSSH